ncbi:hypothetical protein [Lacipirellula sp.]|uniref:hypothetical protein n=1 Tax=Lacipirellula sp. TaxID=2691419 RepID=UPI003D14DD25
MSSNGTLSPEAQRLYEQMRNGGVLPGTMPPTVEAAPKRTAKWKKNPLVAGRFGELNAFVDTTMAKLTRIEVTTWLTLFRYVDSRVGTAQASAEAIAAATGSSKQHTLKAIASLIEKRLLTRVKIGAINRGSSVYRVHPTGHP